MLNRARTKRTGEVVQMLETKENATDKAMQKAFRYSLVLLKGEEAIAHFNTLDECTKLVKAMVPRGAKWYVRDNANNVTMARGIEEE